MRRTVAVIALLGMIPLAGWLVGFYIQWKFDRQFAEVVHRDLGERGLEAIKSGRLSITSYCATPDGHQDGACGTYKSVVFLRQASVGTALTGLALLLGIVIAARLAATNRNLLVTLFAPGLNVVLFVLFALIIAQGAIATYSAYILEATLIQRVHFVIIGGIGLGALIGAFKMINAGLSISRRARSAVLGHVVSNEDQPALWEYVTRIAQNLGAQPPHQIVLGLDPNFYVTSADVVAMPSGATHSDETMYLSLPLMRILSRDELAAVIGHELGHFRGEDTKFSLGFYPIYAGTTQALVALHSESDGTSTLALLPARAILAFFMEEFAKVERKIGRDRELEADRAGASIASPQAMGTALLKLGGFIPIWARVQTGVVEDVRRGRVHRNISAFFADTARLSTTSELVDEVADQVTSHPTDTHPPTLERINALGLRLQDIRVGALLVDPDSSSALLLRSANRLEESLTEVVYKILAQQGVEPEQKGQPAEDAGQSPDQRSMGLCPNCEEKIPLESAACPNCNVLFGTGSEWKVKPTSNA